MSLGPCTPLCSLQQCLPIGPVVDLSLSATTAEKVVSSTVLDVDRRSVTPLEPENTREDGELPISQPSTAVPDDSRTKGSATSSDLVPNRNLALISKI
ncbi:hypothetical protein HPP92_016147 [Vanilla planifolia]|uniref:Uncharacterized protein n=1 Tax=Vanilla planifolia TaxID=51239 RepID=A0A835QIL6_VANPL|nr:hypothetical protein HPP92_016147 [Vanilla planifolia]